MQFLEKNMEGLRSALHELHSPRSPLRFLLVPMVHIADPAFYRGVAARLDGCDHVIVEGVASFRVRLLTMSYKLPARKHALGLVLQRDVLRHESLRAKVIAGDLRAAEFADGWSGIPWLERLSLLLLSPLYGAYLYLFASRSSIIRRCGVESQPTRVAELGSSAFENAIVHQRDRHLLSVIEKHIAEVDDQQTTAVLYGGRHMPVVAQLLMGKYGYRVLNSSWLTAIELRD